MGFSIKKNSEGIIGNYKMKTVDAVNPSFVQCNGSYSCKLCYNGLVFFVEEGVFRTRERIIVEIHLDNIVGIGIEKKKVDKLIITWKNSSGKLFKSTIEGNLEGIVEVV